MLYCWIIIIIIKIGIIVIKIQNLEAPNLRCKGHADSKPSQYELLAVVFVFKAVFIILNAQPIWRFKKALQCYWILQPVCTPETILIKRLICVIYIFG